MSKPRALLPCESLQADKRPVVSHLFTPAAAGCHWDSEGEIPWFSLPFLTAPAPTTLIRDCERARGRGQAWMAPAQDDWTGGEDLGPEIRETSKRWRVALIHTCRAPQTKETSSSSGLVKPSLHMDAAKTKHKGWLEPILSDTVLVWVFTLYTVQTGGGGPCCP